MNELCYMSAGEALALFARRELSPLELMRAVIDRAEQVEPAVNALCHTFFEAALDQARAAEQRYGGRGDPPRPLEGIPLAVKEEEAVTGQPWTHGSLIHRDTIADHTSTFVQRALDAGAIIHARTTAPEFSCAAFTHSRLWGVTRNPWNPDYGVGGSSGGSGAALASGTTVLASGSDIGGSIRIPAAWCGVVGYKPPYGRVPQEPPFNLDTYCHCGPMARTVADCALYENVVAGPDPRDIVSLRPAIALPVGGFESIEGMRIAVSLDLGDWPVDPEIRANTLAVGAALAEQGAVVEQVDLLVSQADVMRATAIHFEMGFNKLIAAAVEAHPDLVSDYVAALPDSWAGLAGGATLLDSYELEARIYAPVGELLERYDALVCPTVASRGLLTGDDYVDHGIEVDGRMLEPYAGIMMTLAFNVMSRCPVLAAPSGHAANGLPTGVQIVGRTYDELTPFRVGAALERARPWLDVPERRPAGQLVLD